MDSSWLLISFSVGPSLPSCRDVHAAATRSCAAHRASTVIEADLAVLVLGRVTWNMILCSL